MPATSLAVARRLFTPKPRNVARKPRLSRSSSTRKLSFGRRENEAPRMGRIYSFGRISGRLRLGALDQFFDSLRVGFVVAMTGNGIGPAGGFDQNLGPDQTRFDMHRSHFADAHAHLVHSEPGPFAAADGFIANFDVS